MAPELVVADPHTAYLNFAEATPQLRRSTFERNNELIANISFRNFDSRQAAQVKGWLGGMGIPLERVSVVSHEPETHTGERVVLGLYDPQDRRLALTETALERGELAAVGTLAHEAYHGASPFKPDNTALYGSTEAAQEAQERIVRVAHQSLVSGRYLNEYHQALAMALKKGVIGIDRYYEETHAIMGELLVVDPSKLVAVQEEQARVYQTLAQTQVGDLNALQLRSFQVAHDYIAQAHSEGVGTVTTMEAARVGTKLVDVSTQAVQVSLTLMPQFSDSQQLVAHFGAFRQQIASDKSK